MFADKDDCNEQSCSGNGKCIDGVIKKSACVCSAGFTGKDCGAESGPGSTIDAGTFVSIREALI